MGDDWEDACAFHAIGEGADQLLAIRFRDGGTIDGVPVELAVTAMKKNHAAIPQRVLIKSEDEIATAEKPQEKKGWLSFIGLA